MIRMVRHKYRDKVEAYVAGASNNQGLQKDTNAALPVEQNTYLSCFKQNNSELPRRAPEDNEGYLLTVSMRHM